MHKHTVFSHESGVVCVKFVGEIATDDLNETLQKLNNALDSGNHSAPKPALIADATELNSVKLNARKIGVAWLKERRYAKLAAICHSIYMRHFVQMLIVASGLGDVMKVFREEEGAIEWLISDGKV